MHPLSLIASKNGNTNLITTLIIGKFGLRSYNVKLPSIDQPNFGNTTRFRLFCFAIIVIMPLFFLFYEEYIQLYKNVEAEICEILGILYAKNKTEAEFVKRILIIFWVENL